MNALFTALLASAALLTQPANTPPTKPANHPGQPAAAPSKPKGNMPAGHPGTATANAGLNWPKARPEDVASVDAIIKAFYAVPAGEKGEPRDWDRYASLFTPDARMIPARPDDKGNATAMFVTIGEYVDLNKSYFEKGGFRDSETHRKVEEFGHIAHVWSTFESRHSAADAEPYVRGINSIQLLKDGDRWWIVNVFWDFEGPTYTVKDAKSSQTSSAPASDAKPEPDAAPAASTDAAPAESTPTPAIPSGN
jgi:hypothetical protein